jgi:hypothetical protein
VSVGRGQAAGFKTPVPKEKEFCKMNKETMSTDINSPAREVDVENKNVAERNALAAKLIRRRQAENEDLARLGENEVPPNERCKTPPRHDSAAQKRPPRSGPPAEDN